MMYDMSANMGELTKIPAVRELLLKIAPQMVEGPAAGYMSAITVQQLAGMQPDAADMCKAILAVANGEQVDLSALDPRKKKPVAQDNGIAAGYEIDDVDGKLFMLDHDFSGCYVIRFSKTMDPAVKGKVTYQGQELRYCIKVIAIAGNMQMMGVAVKDIATEYGKEYTLHLEGFTDTDGNVMDPTDFTFHTMPADQPDPAYAEHDGVALEAAREGIVLLKNEKNVLPLAADEHIRVIGDNDFRMGAVGAGKINPRYAVRLGRAIDASTFVRDDAAQTGIIVISRASGENYDNGAFKGQYYLTDEEVETIKALRASCEKTVAIINSGYPMDVRFIEEYGIDAAIWCGYPGMLGGRAVVDVLNGTVNPSGKLPDTWALDYYDIPAAKNFFMPDDPSGALDADHDVWINTVYEEDIYVGYRYFETFEKPVAYKFGHGLSYTTFDLQSEMFTEDAGDFATVDVTVTNTGKVAGKEVVQIYAAIPDGKLEQPAKRLVAFAKTESLEPGQSETLVLPVAKKTLTSFDEEASAYIIEAGTYTLYVGSSLESAEEVGSVDLAAETVKTVGRYMQTPMEFTKLSKKDPEGTYPSGKLSGIIPEHTLTPRTGRRQLPDQTNPFTEELNAEVDSWSVKELARFAVCASSGWGMQDVGVAGRVSRLEGRDIPYYAVSDGNNGVNINKKNIGMPTSDLVCATWNTDLAYEVGRVIAEEALENDVRMILAPAMNIHRNPLCGRVPEYFSEDPLLAGIMAGNQAKGLEENGIDSSVKHVCCNGSEATRKRNHSILSVRALREIYLKAFEVAVEVHKPASIMTGYNACNGVFTAEDQEMLQGIFRDEWGFDGFVMTDWNSYDTADVATAIQAGNCWMTPGTTDDTYTQPIEDGVANGTIDIKRLRTNAKYMLRVVRGER